MEWNLYIDWNGDYDFGNDIWEDVKSVSWGLGMGRAYQNLADESTCIITLKNHDGKYSPDNPDSPLAGLVRPFKRVKLEAVHDGVTYPMWRGWINTISTPWFPSGKQTSQTDVVLNCIGAKQILQESELNLELQENQRADQIIALMLGSVVLPPAAPGGWLLEITGYGELGVNTLLGDASDYSDLEEGVITFRYYGDIRSIDKDNQVDDKRQDQNAYRVIQDCIDGERGFGYFDREGKFVFWNRDHLLDTIAVSGTVDTDGLIGRLPQGMTPNPYGQNLANRVQVTVYQREEGSTVTLWSLSEPMELGKGEVRTFSAPFTDDNDLQAGAIDQVAVANQVNTGEVELELDTKADRAQVTITADEDSTLTSFDIEGTVLSSTDRIVVEKEDDDSIRAYGRRRMLILNLRTINNYEDADIIADFELRRRKDPRTEIASITLKEHADGVRNWEQIAWSIGDRVRVRADEIPHDEDYYIIGEQHQVSDNGFTHQTSFVLEPVSFTRLTHYGRQHRDGWVELKSGDNDLLGQVFQVPGNYDISYARLYVNKSDSPPLDYRIRICADDVIDDGWELGTASKSELGTATRLNSEGHFPGTVLGSSDVVSGADIEAQNRWIEFTLESNISATPGTDYWLVLEANDPDLVSYWPLEEASGTREDAHGDNDLSDNNTVTQASGLQGNAAQFALVNGEYLRYDGGALPSAFTDGLTVSLWMYFDSLPASNIFLAGTYLNAANRRWNLIWSPSSGGVLAFWAMDADGTFETNQHNASIGAFVTSTWYHAAVRWTPGTTLDIFVDNVKDSAASSIDTLSDGGVAEFGLGARGRDGAFPHDGRLDEVSIWKRALSDAEVTYLYNLGRGRNYQASRAFPDADNFLAWGADGSNPGYANGAMHNLVSGGEWLANGQDAIFEVYAP